ncbi:MAG: SUMF1/EgtB/PvdO family nonheme iron enzyme [Pyrinomonadaceae bacterium]
MNETYRDSVPLMRGDFGATTPNIRTGAGASPNYQTPQGPPPQYPPPGAPPAKKRGIPIWVWLLLGAFLLFLLVAVAGFLYYITRSPGFTLVVVGAPPGSNVYVDNVRRGTTKADGTIQVPELKAGKRILRVAHDGYEDFNTSVTGKDGEIKRIPAQLTPTGVADVQPTGLPAEVDYGGPMLLVGAGEFIMGDDAHKDDEKPAHKVTLPDFYIDKFEVTNEQYKKFSDETKHPYPTDPWWDLQYFKKFPKSPVLGVNWEDATAYAKWAGKRLPTEEEWEKAASWDASAQKKRQFPWGDAPDASKANVGGTQRTSDVGQFTGGASPYGAQDMAGNVAEWVDSFYQPYPGGQTSGADFGTTNRVVRGGTYKGDAEDARTTRRLYHTPQLSEAEKKNRAFLIGFRCAISADDAKLQERISASAK